MAIKLRVISDHYQQLGDQRSRVFGVNGGTVGRAPDNDWVLPDPQRIVSGHHFEIQYDGGSYWLKDTSTNGVFVNGSRTPASSNGPVLLQDGDRLLVGDYEIIVSVDARSDFLPKSGEVDSSSVDLDSQIGAKLDLDSLLSPREAEDTGAVSIRNAYGIKVSSDLRRAAKAAVSEDEPPPLDPMPPLTPGPPEWATRTRPITREELADAIARRQDRLDARNQARKEVLPVHRKAATWSDLQSAVQAFCRGAGIDASALSPEAQEMLPLLAGQLLREIVLGLKDILQAHEGNGKSPEVPGRSMRSNVLRSSSSSVEQTLLQLLESHGRIFGGAVDTLREVLQDIKDHEKATAAALPDGVKAIFEPLDPQKVSDQIRNGRATRMAPGEDPRSRYWEHYAELYRMLTQNLDQGLPHSFNEAFSRSYLQARSELRDKRKKRD